MAQQHRKKVFITGVGGFLGHHLAIKMNALGYKVKKIELPRQTGLHFIRDNELLKLASKGRKTKGATKWRREN